jgi:hypothetical protein
MVQISYNPTPIYGLFRLSVPSPFFLDQIRFILVVFLTFGCLLNFPLFILLLLSLDFQLRLFFCNTGTAGERIGYCFCSLGLEILDQLSKLQICLPGDKATRSQNLHPQASYHISSSPYYSTGNIVCQFDPRDDSCLIAKYLTSCVYLSFDLLESKCARATRFQARRRR